MKNANYGSSLTNSQWDYLKPMLPKPAQRGRPPTDLRRVLGAIIYVVKGGFQWRNMPVDFPPRQTVYGVFQWKINHPWENLNDALRRMVRISKDKRTQPTADVLEMTKDRGCFQSQQYHLPARAKAESPQRMPFR